MRDKEIVGLWEAYQQVCSPQELTEEAQIATEYFYQMGLNGSGIDILVEELGVDEFVEWVYDISDEYTLIEERAAKKRPGGPSYAEVKAGIDAREAEKATKKRERAATKATTKQPETKSTPAQTRQGIGARVAGFLAKGIERHNAANKSLNRNLSTMSAATAKTAGKVGDAASKFKKGFMGEEVENWVNALVEEGYDLSEYTWDDMYEMYVSEGRYTSLSALSRESQTRKDDAKRGRPESKVERDRRLMMGDFRPGRSTEERARGGREILKVQGKVPKKGGKDMFEQVLEYLVAEGYADTNENAIAIMSNMSEEWRGSICEILEIEEGKSDRPLGFMHPFGRGRKQPKGEKTDLKYGHDSEGNTTGKYAKMQKSKRES